MKPSHLFIVVITTLLLSACNFTLAADITPPPGIQMATQPQMETQVPSGSLYPIVAPDPRHGEAIYLEKCEPCHGPSGLGNGSRADQLPNPVLPIGTADFARQAAPADWYRAVTQGNLERFMPPFQSLNDHERWDVVAYTFGLSMSGESLVEGEELYQANCESCHGSSGKGDGPEGEPYDMPDFSNQEFMAARSLADFYQTITDGTSAGMPAFGEDLAEEQRWALAEFVRTLSFAAPLVESAPEEETPVEATEVALETPLPGSVPTGEIDSGEAVSGTVSGGTVMGVVTNASGGELPEGLEVELYGFDQVQVVITATTTVDKDGSYTFENVEMAPGQVFITTLDYEDVTYGSEITTVATDSDVLELPLQFYEATTDSSILKIDRVHLFFEYLGEESLRVVELYIFSNPGTKTLVAEGEGQPVLTFSVPAEAQNLQFQDGDLGGRYISTPDGFGDTMPVKPGTGEYQVLFSYELPYQRSLDFVRPVEINTGAVVILVPEDGIKIKGDNIEDAGIREVQGIPYHMYNGAGLAAGQELHLTLSGRPSVDAPTLSGGSSTGLIVGLGVFGIVLIAAGVWLYRRNRTGGDGLDAGPVDVVPAEAQSAESLMDAILALDDLYQEGELPQEAYLERRAELKARLQEQLNE